MQVSLERLKESGIADSSYKNYLVRLNRLKQVIGEEKEWPWIMAHPIEAIGAIKRGISTNPATLVNYIVPVCKLFSLYPRLQKIHSDAYLKWQNYLKHYRSSEQETVKRSQFSDKQKKNLVEWQEVSDKYCELKADKRIETDQDIHQFWLLLSLLLHMNAKRADLGNIRFFTKDPHREDINYLVLEPKMVLVLNLYKTARVRGAIKEPLADKLAADIRFSLNRFPREFLIVSMREKEPYIKNNSYSQYVKREFLKHFGKAMGVGLWRIVYISATVDFNETPFDELEKSAHYKGHSLAQEFLAYRKVTGVGRAGESKCKPGRIYNSNCITPAGSHVTKSNSSISRDC